MAKADVDTYIDRYADMILRLSFTYMGNKFDAEDICQDVLIKLMLQAPEFSTLEHEKAWVIRTTANRCKDVLKSAYRKTAVELTEETPSPVTSSAEDEALAQQNDVLEAMGRLPIEQRETIYLFYFEGYRIDEIARITHASAAAVSKRLSRARRTMRDILERNRNAY